MAIKEQIREELKKIENKYLDSADEINSDYNRENDVSDDYKGRQIFELLQNAEDECEEGQGKVLIEFNDNIFRISNTGRPFSFDGVKSLLRANNSPKRIKLNTIGNKGLGFRSILNWSNKITVITEGFALEFSKENAITILKSLFKEKTSLETELRKKSKDEYPIAILACPKLVDREPEEGYVTTIEVECKKNVQEDVINQINSLDLKELLFLKGLKEVSIKSVNKNSTFRKEIDGNNACIREIDNVTGNETSISKWRLFNKKGSIEYEDSKIQKIISKNYEMTIAYDFENKTTGNYLYSFFKTKIPLSFPGIIHGTFELTTDRNQLKPDNLLNKQLIDILADFIIDTAVGVSELSNKCNYEPLGLILMQEDSESLKEYGFYNLLKEKVVSKKIFPNIKNEYIYLDEKSYFTTYRYDQVLNKETFKDLLQFCDQEIIRQFLSSRINFYSYDDFCKRINKDVSNNLYSIDEKCEIINLVKNTYGYSGENLNLLVDTNGKSVTNNEKIYIKPTNENIINLPSCIDSVKFLNEQMQEILMGEGTQQTLSDTYKSFGILPYRFNTLINNVLKSLNDSLTEDNILDVLCWLYKFYISNKNDEEEISVQKIQEYKIPVVCRNGIQIATESYFGIEYENKIGELIIGTYSQNFLKNIRLNEDDKDTSSNEVSFFKWIGVSEYPRIKSTVLSLSNNDKNEYFASVFSSFGKIVNDWNETTTKYDFSVRRITLDSVENIEKIIEKSKFEDLLAWIIADENLYSRIKNQKEISDLSKIECEFYRKQYIRNIKKDYLYSYIRFRFQNMAWIQTTNGNQVPKYCCLESLGLEPRIFEPVIDYEYLKKEYGISKLKIYSLLQEIGISDQFIDIPTDIQYEVLMALPDIDVNKKLSRKLYMIMKTHETEEIANTENYRSFLKNGKVLVKYKGEKCFVPVQEALYVDKKVFSDELLQQYKIFDIEHRVGASKVKKIFGVNQINNIDITFTNCVPVTENLNSRFEEDYKDLLPYILVCRKNSKSYKADLGRLKRTTVKLVEQLEFSSLLETEEIQLGLKDYETIYFRNKNSAYIKIPSNINSLENLKSNISFSDAVAEIITTILDVNEDKILFRQLFEGNRSKRDFLIRNDKGDENLELLNGIRKELKYEENLKLDFWVTLGAIKNLKVEDVNETIIIQDLGFNNEIAEKIDYENLNKMENMELLISIFSKLSIKVEEYNSMCINTVNFIPYYLSRFNIIRENFREKYKFYLYSKYQVSKDYKSYERDLNKYSIYEPEIKNQVDFDVEEIFFNLFEINESIINNPDFKTVDKIIEENRKQYSEEYISSKIKISSNNQVDLALLFNDLDSIIEASKVESNINEKKTQKEINSEAEILISEIDVSDVDIKRSDDNNSSVQENESKNTGKGKGKIHSNQDDSIKETHGMAGELAVYKKYKDIYENFQWLSGNAEKYKHISKGDDTLGYDMSYCDKNHQTKYIEVKASNKKYIEFHISKNEINFALKHPDTYELYYVFLDNGKAHIRNLGNIFKFKSGEDLFNNSKFNIENDTYKISCEIIKND